MRRTTSLLMGIPKAKAICGAIRGQPHVGFRRFICTTATMTSWLALWARLPPSPGREQQAIFPRVQRAMEAQEGRGSQDDRGTDQPPRADEEPTHRGDD